MDRFPVFPYAKYEPQGIRLPGRCKYTNGAQVRIGVFENLKSGYKPYILRPVHIFRPENYLVFSKINHFCGSIGQVGQLVI